MTSERYKQAGLALFCAATINCIAWPGPHGGLQFLGELLWSPEQGPPSGICFLFRIPLVLLFLTSFYPYQTFRVRITIFAAAWLGLLFCWMFLQIYPTAMLIALVTSLPFVGSLGGTIWFSLRPKDEGI
jgi:hypothetical protein